MELNGEARSLPLPRHFPLSSDNFVSAYARRPLNPMTTRAIINKAVAAQGGNRVRNPFDPMILLRVHEVLKSPSLTGIPPHSKTRRHSENTDATGSALEAPSRSRQPPGADRYRLSLQMPGVLEICATCRLLACYKSAVLPTTEHS
jgi:hypothetical protein